MRNPLRDLAIPVDTPIVTLRDIAASIAGRWKTVAATTVIILSLALLDTWSARRAPVEGPGAAPAASPAGTAASPESSEAGGAVRLYIGSPSGPAEGVDLVSEAEIVASVAVAEEVARELDTDPEDLLAGLSVGTVGTRVLEISWANKTGQDVEEEAVALAFANGYLKRRQAAAFEVSEKIRSTLKQQLSMQLKQAERLAENLRRAASAGDLRTAELLRAQLASAYVLSGSIPAELAELRATSNSNGGGFILGPGRSPNGTPTSPLPTTATPPATTAAPLPGATVEAGPPSYAKNGAAGLILGLILGSFLALLLAWLDPRFRDAEHLSDSLGVPILATLRFARPAEWPNELARMKVSLPVDDHGKTAKVCVASMASSDNGNPSAAVAMAMEMLQPSSPELTYAEGVNHSATALETAAAASKTVLLLDVDQTSRTESYRVSEELARTGSPVAGIVAIVP